MTTKEHARQLIEWLRGKRPVELLYSPAENTPHIAAEFHAKCDGKGATLTIVKTTNGNIFGETFVA